MQLDSLPEILTVEEAAAVLRVSRGTAYQLARQYLTTGGGDGLPVMRLGRRLVVPKGRLVRWLEGQPATTEPTAAVARPPSPAKPTPALRRNSTAQLSLLPSND